MKTETLNSEPRSRLITDRTRMVLRESKLCVRKFATSVAEHYMRTTSHDERIVRFYTGNGSIESALRAEKRNAQLINRFLSGDVKFPCDLEESWLFALPESYRTTLIRDLAARYGLVGARMPGQSPHHALADLACVLRDAGQTATALAPLFKTGVLNDCDLTHLRLSLAQIQTNITDLVSLHSQVTLAISKHEWNPERAVV